MAALNENSNDIGVVAVTIKAGPISTQCGVLGTLVNGESAPFTSKPVRSCLVQVLTGTAVYMAFRRDATATLASWKLSTTPISVPIDDLAKLNFIGAVNDVVQILYRQ